MKQIELFTDGSCLGNPGPGGWAAILRYGKHVKELSGHVPVATNNQMELLAVIKGLSALKEKCHVKVYTDSAYLIQGINAWLPNWIKRGWRTVKGDPVQNQSLWMEFKALHTFHSVEMIKVKAHNGHKENERCDQLAKAAAASGNNW